MASPTEVRVSEVLSALSYALDLTSGQANGHALRTCVISMRLADALGLPPTQRSNLFYSMLIKDAGCSSNAARIAALFASDDLTVKSNFGKTDISRLPTALAFILRNAAIDEPWWRRLKTVLSVGRAGRARARALVATRCERGADIARLLDFSEETAQAIGHLDERWDGSGFPDGLRGEEIPLLARLGSLAQSFEAFLFRLGLQPALDMARARRGLWFDPKMVDALLTLEPEAGFWEQVSRTNPLDLISALEPEDRAIVADDARLDQIAEAFAGIIDAKSPYTSTHSKRVASVAVQVGRQLGFSDDELRELRRCGLLHDIGKLGVSNRILDKPAKLTEEEREAVERHPAYTQEILERVPSLRGLAYIAAAHHERLDGNGYHRGVPSGELPLAARVLTVADVFDALTSERPYRPALPIDEALAIMRKEVGTGLCPDCFAALEAAVAPEVVTAAS